MGKKKKPASKAKEAVTLKYGAPMSSESSRIMEKNKDARKNPSDM